MQFRSSLFAPLLVLGCWSSPFDQQSADGAAGSAGQPMLEQAPTSAVAVWEGTAGSQAIADPPRGGSVVSAGAGGAISEPEPDPASAGAAGSPDEPAPEGSAGAAGSDPGTAGAPATGGTEATGGVEETGGAGSTGGTAETGGLPSTGGLPATGGVSETGGLPGTGGLGTGGLATGGVQATGGLSATGGTGPAPWEYVQYTLSGPCTQDVNSPQMMSFRAIVPNEGLRVVACDILSIVAERCVNDDCHPYDAEAHCRVNSVDLHYYYELVVDCGSATVTDPTETIISGSATVVVEQQQRPE